MKTALLLLTLAVALLTSCTDDEYKKVKIIQSGEKAWVKTTLYNMGDTLFVYYDLSSGSWKVDKLWITTQDTIYTENGLVVKEAIVEQIGL